MAACLVIVLSGLGVGTGCGRNPETPAPAPGHTVTQPAPPPRETSSVTAAATVPAEVPATASAPSAALSGATAEYEALAMTMLHFSEACAAGKLDKAMEFVSENFVSPGVAANKESFKTAVQALLMNFGALSCDSYSSRVKVSGEEGSVGPVEIVVKGFNIDTFTFLFRKQGDRWLLVGLNKELEGGAQRPEDIRGDSESAGSQF